MHSADLVSTSAAIAQAARVLRTEDAVPAPPLPDGAAFGDERTWAAACELTRAIIALHHRTQRAQLDAAAALTAVAAGFEEADFAQAQRVAPHSAPLTAPTPTPTEP